MSTKEKTPTSKRADRVSTQKLAEVWPKLGPFPWLRTLEMLLQDSPLLDPAKTKPKVAELFEFIRVELRERTATTEAEMAFLRILRAVKVDDQKQMLKLLLEEGAGMPTSDAEAFVDHLNFETLGTGAGGAQ
jgi:hypothetical protein